MSPVSKLGRSLLYQVTGTNSVQNYVRDTSTAQKRSVSASLSSFTTNSLEQNRATINETENAADHNTE